MKKKTVRKKVAPKTKMPPYKFYGYTIVIVSCVMLFILVQFGVTSLRQVQVLGESTMLPVGDQNRFSATSNGLQNSGGNVDMNMSSRHGPGSNAGDPQNDDQRVTPPPLPSGDERPSWTPQNGITSQMKHPHMFGGNQATNSGQQRTNGLQVSHNTAGNFIMKQNGIEAQTKLPVSFNTNTNQLTVTTSNGTTQQISILPNQIVSNLISKGIISGTNTKSTTPVQLTESQNQTVFQVQSVSNKKLLGVFPDSINKTVDVSAQSGTVVSQNESFGQKLLDLFSF